MQRRWPSSFPASSQTRGWPWERGCLLSVRCTLHSRALKTPTMAGWSQRFYRCFRVNFSWYDRQRVTFRRLQLFLKYIFLEMDDISVKKREIEEKLNQVHSWGCPYFVSRNWCSYWEVSVLFRTLFIVRCHEVHPWNKRTVEIMNPCWALD